MAVARISDSPSALRRYAVALDAAGLPRGARELIRAASRHGSTAELTAGEARALAASAPRAPSVVAMSTRLRVAELDEVERDRRVRELFRR